MLAVSPLNLYETAVSIQSRALASSATSTVFPESVVHSWNESTDMFWEPTFAELRKQGRTIIVGATVTRPGRNRYKNVLMLRGAHTATFEQRVPVPYAMWNPLTGEGVDIHPNGPAVFDLNGERVAPLICYEQFLGGPVLLSMLRRPTVLLAVANDYWATGTTIPAIQSESIDAWSRLFWVPTVKAVNQ
jgi:apolipoprotein N-acyltransferase